MSSLGRGTGKTQDTDPKRKVTWVRLSICFKRWKQGFFLGRVVEGKLLSFCLKCFAQLVLQQALHTQMLLKSLCRICAATCHLCFGESQLLPSGEEFTPSPFKLAPNGHLSPEVKASLQHQAWECGGLATGWCGADVWAQKCCKHRVQGQSQADLLFCREHPSFIPKLGIVNFWEWALPKWVSLCCWN